MLDLRVFGGNSFFYPAKDNTYLCFKVLEHEDRDKFIEGFKKLSRTTVYHRFFGFMKELSKQHIDDLLNTDEKNHVAWASGAGLIWIPFADILAVTGIQLDMIRQLLQR